jgi:putative ABC transport system permease protein
LSEQRDDLTRGRARWRSYFRFWGPDIEADVDDELQYHLDMRTEDFVAKGMNREQARTAAMELFGNPRRIFHTLRAHDAKKLRRAGRTDMIRDVAYDFRYALRHFRREPRFSATIVCVLALGIGANSAIFSAIDAAYFRPLPFANPDRLVTVSGATVPADLPSNIRRTPKGLPYLADLQAERSVFSGVAAYATGGLNLVGGRDPIRTTVTFVTTDFFSVLGRMPVLGRPISVAETSPGGTRGAVLSDALWRRQFGGDPSVLGRTVTLNDAEYAIVGVMPPTFNFPVKTDVWVGLPLPYPMSLFEAFRNYMPSKFIARLAPGATAALAAQRIDALGRVLRPSRKRDASSIADLAKPLQQTLVGDTGKALAVLMGGAVILLLIACTNVTNLLLLRASSRRREIAVRVAIGASRTRIVRQLLVESALLATAGALLAVLVARVTVGTLGAVLPASLAGVAPPTVDVRVLGFAILLAMVTSILVGLWPAVGATRISASDALKIGAGATQHRGAALRGLLVVAEVALALMLVVGAGLVLESLRSLLRVDTGMRGEHVATARLSLPGARYNSSPVTTGFINDVLRAIKARPGVVAAGAVNSLPMAGEAGIGFRTTPENAPPDSPRAATAELLMATPGYFSTIGTPLRGDDLPATYDSTNKVAIINTAMAKVLWPNEDAIGKRLVSPLGGPHTVIGVVADIRVSRADSPPEPQVYFPLAEAPSSSVAIVASGTGDPAGLLRHIDDAVRAVDPKQPTFAGQSLDQLITASVAPRRTNAMLFSVFGSVALILAAVGIYAVIGYGVEQRAREFGIRMALGAEPSDVVTLVLAKGVWIAIAGVALGTAAAFAASRVLQSLLYETSHHDARIFIAAPIALLAIALIASWLPARSAVRVSPLEALREG